MSALIAKTTAKRKKCLLLGSYGRGNIGDDVFLLAALELLPEYDLYINSADDSLLSPEVRARVTTIATGDLRDTVKKAKVFASIQTIIYCGGDLWVELYGDRSPRKSLYKMVVLNFAARVAGKKVYYMGCGVGKLAGYSLWLAQLSARLANGVLVREQRSADVLALRHVQVAPDLAVNLPYFQLKKKPIKVNNRKFVIGISLIYFIPNPEHNFPRLVEGLARFIEALPQDKFKFILLPMLVSNQTPHDDLWASEQLRNRLPEHDIEINISKSVKECVGKLARFDFLIAVRLHASILATLSGVPCIGLSYRPKVKSFFRDNNLDNYCLDLHKYSDLEKLFWDMYDNYAVTTDRFFSASKHNIWGREAYQEFVSQL